MKIPSFEKTRMLTPTTDERLTANPAVVFSLFMIVNYLASQARSGVYRGIVALWPHKMTFNTSMLIQLGATLAPIAVILLYCLVAERRTLLSLGFSKRGVWLEYGIGLLGGVILFGGAVLLCMATGTLTIRTATNSPNLLLLALFFIGFLIDFL